MDYDQFMAQKIQTLFICDLDGDEAAGIVASDLTARNTRSISVPRTTRNSAEPWSSTSGTRAADGTARRAARGSRGSGAVDTAKVREWAKGQGIETKDRSRVPANVVEKYKTAVGA
jgi:hypothetical protein